MMGRFSAYFVYFYWLCIALSVAAVLWIVGNKSDPGYKIAWIIPILLFPVFGGLIYLLLGGNRLSLRQRRKMQGMERQMVSALERDCKAGALSYYGADAVNRPATWSSMPTPRLTATPRPSIFPWGTTHSPGCWRSCGRLSGISSWSISSSSGGSSGTPSWRCWRRRYRRAWTCGSSTTTSAASSPCPRTTPPSWRPRASNAACSTTSSPSSPCA